MMKIRIPGWSAALYALVMAGMVVSSGCASQESADHEQEAVAVGAEPAEDEERDGDGDGEDGAEDHRAGADEAPGAASPGAAFREDRCQSGDGEPGAEFFVDQASIHVQQCCDDSHQCLWELTFAGGDKSLAISGDDVDAERFSPDGRFLLLTTSEERTYFSVPVDRLQALADDSDDARAPITVDELAEDAAWTLDVDAVHRLEALSARAVDEAREKCDSGVHLPTLLERAEGAEPHSDRLDVEFEGWRTDSTVELSTKNSDGGATTMRVDVDTECMERTVAES